MRPIKSGLVPVFAVCLALFLGCAKDPSLAAEGLLKSGDRVGALKLLEAARLKRPEDLALRCRLFVLYRYLAAQGDPAGHDAYVDASIKEYEAVVKAAGIAPDYKDMEGSLRASDKSRAAYEAAYAAVYAR